MFRYLYNPRWQALPSSEAIHDGEKNGSSVINRLCEACKRVAEGSKLSRELPVLYENSPLPRLDYEKDQDQIEDLPSEMFEWLTWKELSTSSSECHLCSIVEDVLLQSREEDSASTSVDAKMSLVVENNRLEQTCEMRVMVGSRDLNCLTLFAEFGMKRINDRALDESELTASR